jgi:hypothetical protein
MTQYDPNELGRDSARKRASRLVQEKPLIQGSLVESLRTCGTSGCRCHHGGPKHSAAYLAIRYGKRRAMVCVPEALLPYVKECIANHQHLQQALDIVSRDCIEVFLLKKRTREKKS